MHQEPILFDEFKASGAATNEDLQVGPVPPGQRWTLHHVAAEDETTAFTSLRLGIKRGVSFLPLEEQKSPAAATLYSSQDPWYLESGNILVARFNGTTSGDLLRLYANGVATPVGPQE